VPKGSEPDLPVALYVGGTADHAHGRGWNKTSVTIDFYIDGLARAEQVAAFFKIKATMRRHPGHQIEVSFKPVQDKFDPKQRIAAILRIRNVGQSTVAFKRGGRNGGTRDNQYEFVCRYAAKQVVDIGKGGHLGGLFGIKKLKPGETFEQEVDLTKWFSFDKSGTYDLLGSYYMDFFDSENVIWPIWTDYATAGFSIRIQ
jgi:hypothetical protein